VPLDRRLVALMAVAGGASVANLYYIQPLLPEIAGRFSVSDAAAGSLVTASQVGYAAGLVLLVPLGDVADRRALAVRLLAVCGVALCAAAAAPSLVVLALALAVTATTSAVAQVLVPFAGLLAGEDERGRVVGLVMSGLLTGILLARTVSGLLASVAGWRAPFAAAAVLAWLLAVALWRRLPRVEPSSSVRYRTLIASTGHLIATTPLLRRRMAYGACGFAGFSIAWTALAFLLSRDPYNYGERTISLFGLAGLAGAVAARRLGRLADGGRARRATGLLLVAAVAGWGALALGARSPVPLVLGLILMDFAVQGQNVLSQALLTRRGPETAGRMTTAYVTSNFAGGALGSAAGAFAWTHAGWTGVCAAGAATPLVAAVLWLTDRTEVHSLD
jgi:predicted MFS family arabinose efflux permease